MVQRTRYLIVAHGPDAGARLVIDRQPKMVGRARDADLVLADRSVSRHHFQIVLDEEGTHVHVCPNAAPLLHEGRDVTEVVARVGDSFVAGDTVLMIADSEVAPASRPPASYDATMVHALLSGPAADARALAALFALNEALGAVEDMPALESALASWARQHAECAAVEWTETPDVGASGASEESILEAEGPDGRAKIVVAAHGASARWIVFLMSLPPHEVTDLSRRLLLVAAQICASRITQISALRTVKAECETFRQQAVGSARAFLGKSTAAERLVRIIPKLAASETVVLLTGETGVGKSFVARLIHEMGPRKDEPMRVINCAAIPDHLIESELFGHERGAFTGAVAARVGALESAGQGTLLLDEIGELPLASQAKLLRVLEERRFERVGSNRSLTLRARIVAATNRDLLAMVNAGTFRSDLYFRISVVTAVVPPLRSRGDDLLVLAQQILADFAPSAGRRIDGFSPEALAAIRKYSWPGNVRELRNAIEHAVVLGEGPIIGVADLPQPLDGQEGSTPAGSPHRESNPDPFTLRLPARLELVEKRAIEAALLQTGGNRSKAAALLGVTRQTLYNKLQEGTG